MAGLMIPWRTLALCLVVPSPIGKYLSKESAFDYYMKILVLISSYRWVFGTVFIFPYVGNFIIPSDELIFFSGVG